MPPGAEDGAAGRELLQLALDTAGAAAFGDAEPRVRTDRHRTTSEHGRIGGRETSPAGGGKTQRRRGRRGAAAIRVKGWEKLLVAVIDIGTNTTRLLVAEVEGDRVRTRLERRHFVSLAAQGVPSMVELIEREVGVARRAGVPDPAVVGTAGLRRSPDMRRLGRACERTGIGRLRVLAPDEEADLAFLGATAGDPHQLPQSVAVIDVGGGSTEIVVGAPGRAPEWWASRPVGSQNLTERALLSDPPSADQLGAARNAAARRLAGLEAPHCEIALVAGGPSLRRLSGGALDRQGIGTLLDRLLADRSERVGERLGLAAQRVRLLPAALVVLEAVCELVPEPLRIAPGGVREGLAISLARDRTRTGSELR